MYEYVNRMSFRRYYIRFRLDVLICGNAGFRRERESRLFGDGVAVSGGSRNYPRGGGVKSKKKKKKWSSALTVVHYNPIRIYTALWSGIYPIPLPPLGSATGRDRRGTARGQTVGRTTRRHGVITADDRPF